MMKLKIILRSLTAIICLLISFCTQAEDVALTLRLYNAGSLPTLISESDKYRINRLTLIGDLNGTDIKFIRDMAGQNSSYGVLTTLDLSEANIVSGGDSYYSYGGRYYFTSNRTIGDYAFYGTHLINITLPNSITTIGSAAFRYCTYLRSVIIPDGVTLIRNNAFSYCESLTNVAIANSVTTIGEEAFAYCENLKDVTIGTGITEIGVRVFHYCTSLENITIPSNIISIREAAFYGSGLKYIVIPDNIRTIGYIAFGGCADLINVNIGKNVSIIGERAFEYCTKLRYIIVSEENANYAAIDNVLCSKDKTVLITYPNDRSLAYTIPSSITSIQRYAFYGCTNLNKITIPNPINIGDYAFYGCDNINEIHINYRIPPTYFFQVNRNVCKLYVPHGSLNAYRSALGWRDFLNIFEASPTTNDFTKNKTFTISNISNGICIKTDNPVSVSIFNLSGQNLYEANIQGDTNIKLNKGIYVVRIGDETQKIVVN